MASLRTLPSTKNFIACFTDTTGRRLQRSTGTHVRKDAMKIAEQYEEAARRLKTEAQIRKVLSELYEQLGGSPLPSSSVRSFLANWAGQKAKEVSGASSKSYSLTATLFVEHLGDRADLDLSYLTATDVRGFRDALSGRLSAPSVNHNLKILRVAINSAIRAGLIASNPATQVENVKLDKDSVSRRAFTEDELQRIFAAANPEWQGIIAFGLYTGQRLGDIARLTWGNVDLARKEIRLVTMKTGRTMILPLVRHLETFLSTLKGKHAAKEPLFPEAFAAVGRSKDGKVGTLSNQFHALLARAGLVASRKHASTGKGRGRKRVQSEISFHALRHTATSLLKNAGVSDVVAREFVGHDSAAVSKHYTHIETETLRQAAEKMPELIFPAAGSTRVH